MVLAVLFATALAVLPLPMAEVDFDDAICGRLPPLVVLVSLLTALFLSLATAPLTFLKVQATGLAGGILVGSLVVRCLLVPSLASLLGERNWKLRAAFGRLLLLPVQDRCGDEPLR